jgi:hypothetical protein
MKKIFYKFYHYETKLGMIYIFDLDQNFIYNYSIYNDIKDSDFKLSDNRSNLSLFKEFNFLKEHLNNSIEINEKTFNEILNSKIFDIKVMSKKKFLEYFDLIEHIL